MTRDVRRLRIGAVGTTYLVEVPAEGPLAVEGSSSPVEVTRVDQTTFHVTADGRRVLVHVAVRDGEVWAFADGCAFQLDLAPDRPMPHRASGLASSLDAPMPATVVTVLVAPGQTVHRGETLLVLEAMKMELALRAPRDGTVDELACQVGDLVQPGVPLVTIRHDQG